MLGEKGNYEFKGISEAETIKRRMMKKNSQMSKKKASGIETHQRNNHKDTHSALCQIRWTILKMDKWEIGTNESKDKEIEDDTQGLIP